MPEFDTEYMLIQRIDIAGWLENARNTHSEYVENNRFPRHQNISNPTTMSFL
jgi:hypothetical protein